MAAKTTPAPAKTLANLPRMSDLDAVRGPAERLPLITAQIEDLEREKLETEIRHSSRIGRIAEAIAAGKPEPPELPAELRSIDDRLAILHRARGIAMDERDAAMRAGCRAALEATRGRRLDLARDIEAALEALESAEAEAEEFHRHLEEDLGYARYLVGATRFGSFGLGRVREKLACLARDLAAFERGEGN